MTGKPWPTWRVALGVAWIAIKLTLIAAMLSGSTAEFVYAGF